MRSPRTDSRRAQGGPARWRSRAPWIDKLRPDLAPRVVPNPRGPGTLLVPTPLLVAEEIQRIPAGATLTTTELRHRLAKRYGATAACPLTTGILLHIVAGATEEDLAAGRPPTAPYWRLIEENGCLNSKWPPGPARQAEHLRQEGHRVREDRQRGVWRVEHVA